MWIVVAACGDNLAALPDASGGEDASIAEGDATFVDLVSGCPSTGPEVYSPYRGPGKYPNDTVGHLPWRGTESTYPDGDEAFASYGTLPATVECGDDKGRRSYVDVTAGCLLAVQVGTYTRGQIRATADGYYRSLALGYTPGSSLPAKWTDQGVEYRFYYKAQTGLTGNPGFKAFTRYRTEDDLYVASWRTDGVAQIQKKHCGVYTPLVIVPAFGAPAANTWHTIRFTAKGDKLELSLDGAVVASVNDASFSWGTTGIRIDSMDSAYLDDWRVFDP